MTRAQRKLDKAAKKVCPDCPAQSLCGGSRGYCNAVFEEAGIDRSTYRDPNRSFKGEQ